MLLVTFKISQNYNTFPYLPKILTDVFSEYRKSYQFSKKCQPGIPTKKHQLPRVTKFLD